MEQQEPTSREALSDCLDTLRAIIDQGALKNVAHIADGGDALRVACHESITKARAVLARLESAKS